MLCFTIFVVSCTKDSDLLLDYVVVDEQTTVSEELSEDKSTETEVPLSDSEQTVGASYCGPYTKSEPLVLSGLKDLVISELEISNPTGVAIFINNCDNIIIENSYLHNSKGNGVQIENSTNIMVRNNRMDSISTGVYAIGSQGVMVLNNDVKNVIGPFPRGQLAQFNNCFGANNKINYNAMENVMGESYAEDGINLYASSGTAESPLEIIGNWIRGGGPSGSGGGIMTGDQGGSQIVVYNNILVDPGQYGIAIAGGEDIAIYDNQVYAKRQSFTNVGIYVWNQYDVPCGSNSIYNNTVYWENKNITLNAAWNSKNCGTVIGWETNFWNADIDASILPEQILLDCMP